MYRVGGEEEEKSCMSVMPMLMKGCTALKVKAGGGPIEGSPPHSISVNLGLFGARFSSNGNGNGSGDWRAQGALRGQNVDASKLDLRHRLPTPWDTVEPGNTEEEITAAKEISCDAKPSCEKETPILAPFISFNLSSSSTPAGPIVSKQHHGQREFKCLIRCVKPALTRISLSLL